MLNTIPSKTIFYGLLFLGAFLRFLHFGNIPVGFHGDEASVGYESFSLLNTGADRWGLKLPAYFLSWGSGQNTLYSYLSIPFVSVFGLNEFSVRLLSGVLGIACIPIVYWLTVTLFNSKALARLASILYLFDPFLFMTSRWGEEINILPFFILLFLGLLAKSLTLVSKNLLSFSEKAIIIFVFPAMVLLFYTYAPTLFIIPLFLIFILTFYWNSFRKKLLLFGISAGVGLVFCLPFLLFILKNNILKHSLPFEQSLPFSLPIMLSPRERIFIGIGENLAIIKQNMFFVFSGFIDTYVWIYNSTHFRTPHFFVVFIIPAIIYLAIVFKRDRSDPKNIILFWLLASFSVFFLFHVNLNRSLHFQSVVPLAVAIGLHTIYQKLRESLLKKLLLVSTFVFFMFQASSFFGEYFIKFPNYCVFPKDVKWALDIAEKNKKPGEKIAITKNLVFNYLHAAFYSKYPPLKFQKEVITDKTTGNVIVHSFGDFYFLGDVANLPKPDNMTVIEKLQNESTFVAMLPRSERGPSFNNFTEQIIAKDENHDWKVVRFIKK